MPLGLDYGLIAALCWGSTDVMASLGGRRLGSLHVVAIAQVSSLVIVVAIGIARGRVAEPIRSLLAGVGIFGVMAAGAYLSFFTALRIGPLAVVSPVVAAYGGLTVVLSVALAGRNADRRPGHRARRLRRSA